MVYALSALLAFVAFVFGFNLGRNSRNNDFINLYKDSAQDRSTYLRIIRRELANAVIQRDPDGFVDLVREIEAEVSHFPTRTVKELTAERQVLCGLFPSFSDFDIAAVREYVLYDDAFQSFEIEDIKQKYREVVMFHALTHHLDHCWKMFPPLADLKSDHLEKYSQRVRDTQLKFQVLLAVEKYISQPTPREDLVDRTATVANLFDPFETKLGVHLKRADAYFVYSKYLFDDGQVLETIYRSDPSFNESEILRPIDGLEQRLRELSGLLGK